MRVDLLGAKTLDMIISHLRKSENFNEEDIVKKRLLFILCILISAASLNQLHACNKPIEYVTIAILAKDKAHTLPIYLSCIEQQTWPAEKTYLYIRTNNNNDDTAIILRRWVEKISGRYAEIYFDDFDVCQQVQKYKQHEWNYERFKVLGAIRQDSLRWAQQHQSHYFVADCDNFIANDTIESLMRTNLNIVAPILTGIFEGHGYANYHAAIDASGYSENSLLGDMLFTGEIKGLVEVPVVHCTYFIRHEVLDKVNYDDMTGLHEYVIFSKSARNAGIAQYIDTRKMYGLITFAETAEELRNEPWYGITS